MNKNLHFKCPWSYLCFSILAHKQHKLEARVNHTLVTTSGTGAAARFFFFKIKEMSHVSCTLNVICFPWPIQNWWACIKFAKHILLRAYLFTQHNLTWTMKGKNNSYFFMNLLSEFKLQINIKKKASDGLVRWWNHINATQLSGKSLDFCKLHFSFISSHKNMAVDTSCSAYIKKYGVLHMKTSNGWRWPTIGQGRNRPNPRCS